MREAESKKTKTKREDRTCEINCKHSRAKPVCDKCRLQTGTFLVYIVLPLLLLRANCKQANQNAIQAKWSAIQANWNVI